MNFFKLTNHEKKFFFVLTVLVLAIVIATAFAAPHDNVEIKEAIVEVEEAQMPFYNPMFNGWNNQYQQQNYNSYKKYPIDYSETKTT